MNSALAQQTATALTHSVRRWDRRRRLALLVVWLPRGLMLGLSSGVFLALVAWRRPWLLPEEVLTITAALSAGLMLAVLAVVGAWPRSVAHSARYFDRRFDLKERVSTALELSTGRITAPESLAELQLADAAATAGRVRARARLPLRFNGREIAALLVLAVLLALLLRENPQAGKLRAERELESAVAAQVAALDEAIEAIERDPTLSPEEREALTRPLEEARDILQQPDVSQEEAVAALAEASQSLGEMSGGMTPQDEAAYQQAARPLSGSEQTADLAEAMARPDLGETAEALDDLADELAAGDLDEQVRQDLAGRLDEAADALEEQNPALAQKLRETAEALREGDLEGAQESLREASDLLREQQEQAEQSPLAEAARVAQQQAAASEREMAQAGHDQPAPEQDAIFSAETGAEQGADESSDLEQPPSGAQAAQPEASGEADSGEQMSAEASAGEGEGQQMAPSLSQGGETAMGDEPSAEGQGESADSVEAAGESALGAGAGLGEAGSEETEGVAGEGPSAETPGQVPAGGLQEYTPEHAPSTLGGPVGDMLDVSGQGEGEESPPVQSGEFGPNPAGESALSYTGVLSAFRNVVSNALESGRIPLDQRDVIHDYFSSLQR